MSSVASIAVSGMNAAQAALGSAAHNVANAQTADFHRQLVQQTPVPTGGVATRVAPSPEAGSSLEADMVGLLQSKNAFLANLAVFKADDQMMGSLLDVQS